MWRAAGNGTPDTDIANGLGRNLQRAVLKHGEIGIFARLDAAHEVVHMQGIGRAQRNGMKGIRGADPLFRPQYGPGTCLSVDRTPGGEQAVSSFYLALANPTQQLTKPVRCDRCNLSMFTAVPATQFFCQTCGCVSSVPSQGAESLYDEKMQDAEDLDCKMSSY